MVGGILLHLKVKILHQTSNQCHIIQKQLDVMLRVGNVGRFMALDLIDKISTIGSTLSSNLDKMTVRKKQIQEFLMKELNKIDKQEDNAEKLKVE